MPAPLTGTLTKYIWTALPLVGTAFLVPRLVLWAQTSLSFVAWPWQFDLAEGVNLDASVLLSEGHNIYAHNGPEAFTSAPYTPLFYLLNVPFNWWFGPTFLGGRLISILASAGIAVLLVYVTARISDHWPAGVLAGALWLSASPVIVWSALYTQSILAPALGFAGLALTLRYTIARGRLKAGGQGLGARSCRRSGSGMARYARADPRPSCPGLWSGSLVVPLLLFALAFYAKQTALDAAAATLLWLTIRDPKQGGRSILWLLALIVVPFAAANVALSGGLWEKVIANHSLSWSVGRAIRIVGRLWGEYWPLIVAAGIYALGMAAWLGRTAWERRGRQEFRSVLSSPWALALYYFLTAGTSVLARAGGDGINYNHLLDVIVPICLLAGLTMGWALRALESRFASLREAELGPAPSPQPLRPSLRPTLGIVILALLLGAQLLEYADPHSWYSGMWPDEARNGQMQALSKLVAATPGDILSDDAYLLLHNGRRDLYDDTFMLVSLSALGRWDDTSFVQSIRDRRYSLMFLFGLDRWSPTQRQALSDNYSLKFPDVLSTYVPLISPASPQYDLACQLSNQNDSIHLQGYSLAPGVAAAGIRRGGVLRATLYWRPISRPVGDYASYLHLVNDKGEKVASQDNPHTGAALPTNDWSAGVVVTDTASIPLPSDLLPGRYRLVAGMYQIAPGSSLQALASACEQGDVYGNAVSLGWVEVR